MHDMAIFLGGHFSNENIIHEIIDEKMLIDTLSKLFQKSLKNSTKIIILFNFQSGLDFIPIESFLSCLCCFGDFIARS